MVLSDRKTIRYFLCVWATLECALFAGVIFGWGSLVFIFKEEGIYSNLCENQDEVLNVLQVSTPSQMTQQFLDPFYPVSSAPNFNPFANSSNGTETPQTHILRTIKDLHTDATTATRVWYLSSTPVLEHVTERDHINSSVTEVRFKVCYLQDSKMSLCFMIATLVGSLSTLLIGHINFRFGTRDSRLIACVCYTAGLLCMAFVNIDLPWLMFPGLSLLYAGGFPILITNVQISNLFVSGRSTIICVCNGAVDTSAALLLIVKVAFQGGLPRQSSFLIICGLHAAMVLTSTLVFLPKTFIKDTIETQTENYKSLTNVVPCVDPLLAQESNEESNNISRNKANGEQKLSDGYSCFNKASFKTKHLSLSDNDGMDKHKESDLRTNVVNISTRLAPKNKVKEEEKQSDVRSSNVSTSFETIDVLNIKCKCKGRVKCTLNAGHSSGCECKSRVTCTLNAGHSFGKGRVTCTRNAGHRSGCILESSKISIVQIVRNETKDFQDASIGAYIHNDNILFRTHEAQYRTADETHEVNGTLFQKGTVCDEGSIHGPERVVFTEAVKSLKPYLKMPMLYTHLIWFWLVQLGFLYTLGNLNAYLYKVLNNDIDKVSYFTNVAFITLMGGIVTSILVGILRDWQKVLFAKGNSNGYKTLMPTVLPLSIPCIVSITSSCLLLMEDPRMLYPMFICIVILRSFLFSMLVDFFVVLYPTEYIALFYGIALISGSVVGCAQYGLFAWSESYEYAPMHVQIFLLCIAIVALGHPLYIWWRGWTAERTYKDTDCTTICESICCDIRNHSI